MFLSLQLKLRGNLDTRVWLHNQSCGERVCHSGSLFHGSLGSKDHPEMLEFYKLLGFDIGNIEWELIKVSIKSSRIPLIFSNKTPEAQYLTRQCNWCFWHSDSKRSIGMIPKIVLVNELKVFVNHLSSLIALSLRSRDPMSIFEPMDKSNGPTLQFLFFF